MLDSILPSRISNALNHLSYSSLCELRLRNGSPIVVNLLGENYYLGESRAIKDRNDALSIGEGVLQSIVQKLSDYSLYSVNDEIVEGYIAYNGGIRVGVCGEVVMNDNNIMTIKNISSLNFRFPHSIKNCSLNIYPYIVSQGELKSTLIISPPGAGKTTYLRDLIVQLSSREDLINILVVDERQELTSVFDGSEIQAVKGVDVYKSCSKGFAFHNGIRSMKPDVIITDELNLDRDIEDIENALTSGVKIIASIHASSIQDLKNKSKFRDVLNKGLFERFVVLSKDNGVGIVTGIYNQNLKIIGM